MGGDSPPTTDDDARSTPVAPEAVRSRHARALRDGGLAEWSLALPSGRWLVARGLDDVYGAGVPGDAAAANAAAATRRPTRSADRSAGRRAGDGETGGANDDSPLTAAAFGERLHPEDRPKLAAAYRRLAGAGVPLALEVRIVRTDGQPCWIRVDGEVSERREGEPTRLSGHVRDVTELTRLRSANAFLAGLGVPLARLDDYDDTLQRIASDAVPFLADRCIIEFVTESGSLVRVADSSYPPLVAGAVAAGEPARSRAGGAARSIGS